ncbi:LysR family transcriptional regulator [Frigidibacter albus]|uniref:LysR family transcriptional regulator n=1 Tax=Frigidibacter albus TaxID=1465486 RepID=A0A6L8VB52_9RHOB|nr:LysR substrate-binding domain-containing protein [Frigidibacter albus]MZQ87494.1 LysR family transcriptional regulator [Frigidibacter albus]NBE29400.1 LysR family transcriptional regulator [Frigidibacter albus]GGH45168.1 transcriptional regulator [Frigidibacter albus]
MDSRQLRYFAAIYDRRSLTGAAESERVAVSALSYHLANLEAELGSALFERKPRGLHPTAAGERLNTHARAILRAMDAAARDLSSIRDTVSGEVTVGLAYSAVKAIGVDLARRVLAEYPDLTLILSESLSGTTLLHLKSADVDLALVYNPPPTATLRATPLLEETMVLVGRRDMIGDTDAPITVDELLTLPIILLRQGVSARALLEDVQLLRKLEARARLQMNSVQAIAGSLVAGLGCAIGTKLFMREQIESGALHWRPIIDPVLTRTLFLCEIADRPPTIALETTRALILGLIAQAVASGDWEARLL